MIVNQTFAERFWPGENPLGRRIRANGVSLEVVGVARDVKHRSLTEDSQFFLYGALQQVYRPDMTLIVRTLVDPRALILSVRQEIRNMDAALPVFGIMTMDEHAGLAALGVYGVVSYSVGLRIREIGLRVALGAGNWDISWLVFRQGLIPTLIGTAAGAVAAFGVTRFMEGLLFGISPTDPATFVAICSLLLAVALAASLLPALRAMRVDPQMTLRHE